MRSRTYVADTDDFGILTVAAYDDDGMGFNPTVAERYPDAIYFEATETLTFEAVERVLADKTRQVNRWLAMTIVSMGAFESYDDLEGAIIEDLASFAQNVLRLPALNTTNLAAYRAAADAAGIDHDGDTIGGPR